MSPPRGLSELAPAPVGFLPTRPADLPCLCFPGQEQGGGCLGRGQDVETNSEEAGRLHRGDESWPLSRPPLHREAPGAYHYDGKLWVRVPRAREGVPRALRGSEGRGSFLRCCCGHSEVCSPFCRASLHCGAECSATGRKIQKLYCLASNHSCAWIPVGKLLTSPCLSFPSCKMGMMPVPSALSCFGDDMS